jgi:hypothetical protein
MSPRSSGVMNDRRRASTSRVMASASSSRALTSFTPANQRPERLGAQQRRLHMAREEFEEALLPQHERPKPSEHERLAPFDFGGISSGIATVDRGTSGRRTQFCVDAVNTHTTLSYRPWRLYPSCVDAMAVSFVHALAV